MNKHKAVDQNGKIHTRNSAGRTYVCTVVARGTLAHDLTGWRAQVSKNDISNYNYYAKRGDAVHLEGCKSAKEYAERMRDGRIAVMNNTDYSMWHNIGWCGRADLAQKLISQFSNCGFQEFDILPATMEQSSKKKVAP